MLQLYLVQNGKGDKRKMTKEELEKEAEEYAINQWEGNLPWSVIQKSYYDGALPREKRIAELEKENAELKKQLEHRNCVDCSNHGSNIKLLKAKEIIKNLLFLHNDKFGSTRLEWRCNVVTEAEQFIKESE
jgi:hypothetical protein